MSFPVGLAGRESRPQGEPSAGRLEGGAAACFGCAEAPCGRIGVVSQAFRWGGRLAEHMLTTALFAVIIKSHIIEKECIP